MASPVAKVRFIHMSISSSNREFGKDEEARAYSSGFWRTITLVPTGIRS
jgi:hypothetical protein